MKNTNVISATFNRSQLTDEALLSLSCTHKNFSLGNQCTSNLSTVYSKANTAYTAVPSVLRFALFDTFIFYHWAASTRIVAATMTLYRMLRHAQLRSAIDIDVICHWWALSSPFILPAQSLERYCANNVVYLTMSANNYDLNKTAVAEVFREIISKWSICLRRTDDTTYVIRTDPIKLSDGSRDSGGPLLY